MVKANVVVAAFAAFAAQAAAFNMDRRTSDIVGGKSTDIKEVPYQVAFFTGEYLCGGTILNKDTILTAGHCVDGTATTDMSILAGNTKTSGGPVVNVSDVFLHPKYDHKDPPDYDVALLKLATPLTFGEGIQAVGGIVDKEPAVGEVALISGWGATSESSGVSETLMSVQVPVISRDACTKKYQAPKYNLPVTDRMICAAYDKGGKDACGGDSGGPFVINQKIAGIVSWGAGCARADAPGVYTNVAHPDVHDFISTHL